MEEVKDLLNKCDNCKLKECIRLWIYIYRHTKDKRICERIRISKYSIKSRT